MEKLIIAQFANSEAEFIQFDICEQNGDTYTTLHDDGYGYTDKNLNIVYLGSNTCKEDFKDHLKSGILFLRLRGWNYQQPISDAECVFHISVCYYDFGPYVPIHVGNTAIEWKQSEF